MHSATIHHQTQQAEACAFFMRRSTLAGCFALTGFAGFLLFAQGSFAAEQKSVELIEEHAEYQAALRSLSGGLPEVAALKWERLLKTGKLTQEDVAKVGEHYVDALLRARLADRALPALAELHLADEDFWRGQCLLELREFVKAEGSFEIYLTQPNKRYSGEARLALAQAMIAQGHENTGRKELKNLLNHKDAAIAQRAKVLWNESEVISDHASAVLAQLGERQSRDFEIEFVKACAYLSEGDGRHAQIILRQLLDFTDGVSERVHEACVVRLAESYAMQGISRTAQKILIEYLGAPRDRQYEEPAFALLRRVAGSEDDSVQRNMLEWAGAPLPASRQALALYYYSEWLSNKGRHREAIKYIEDFLVKFPNHTRESEALRLAMECHGVAGNDERVLELATLWKEKFSSSTEGAVNFLTAMIRFSRKEFGESAKLFQQAADAAVDIVQKQRAIYNQAVAALRDGQPSIFESCYVQLQKAAVADNTDASDNPAARLMLERALQQASVRDANAESALQEFIKTYPNHPRVIEAQIAIAELCLLAVPSRTKSAEVALGEARKIVNAPDSWKERVDYTEIWVRETDADLEGAAAQGLAFIQQWPKSARGDEVRMKAAQSYYKLEEYTKALAQFIQLAEEKAESPYAEAAKFFAGKSAMALMNEKGIDQAIEFWRQVAEGGGPLAMEARRQQVLAKRRQGKDSDALAAIDAMLTGKPAPAGEMRLSLLLEKGEMLFVSVTKSPKNLEDAAAIFQTVRQDPTASRSWRGRAGMLLAQCYERMNKTSEALEACYDVVETTLSAEATKLTPSDYLWLYRAGFFALDLLEAKKEWEGAAKLADRLAQTGGERVEEARKRATKIKIEHFIWDK